MTKYFENLRFKTANQFNITNTVETSKMFKIHLLLFIVTIVLLINECRAECCYGSKVSYCSKVGLRAIPLSCQKTICKDGTVTRGYCGVGTCNLFGCNCDGGCRRAEIINEVTESVEPTIYNCLVP